MFAPVRLRRRAPRPDTVTLQYAPIHVFTPQPALGRPIRQRVVLTSSTAIGIAIPPASESSAASSLQRNPPTTEPPPTQGESETFARPAAISEEYYVDVPAGVYPGEPFRTCVSGEEYLIVCPEIEEEGERIMISINRVKDTRTD